MVEIPSAGAPFVVAEGAPAEPEPVAPRPPVGVVEAPVVVIVGRPVNRSVDWYVTQLEDEGTTGVYGGVTGPVAG